MAQDHPVRIGSRVVLYCPSLRAWDGPYAGATDGVRAHDSGRRVATRFQAAHDAPTLVGNKPGSDRRAFFEVPVPDPDVRARPLDDRSALDGRTRRCQCGDLGSAGPPIAGTSGSETAARCGYLALERA